MPGPAVGRRIPRLARKSRKPSLALKVQEPLARERPPLPAQSSRPASRRIAKPTRPPPAARSVARSSPTSSAIGNDVDQLSWSRLALRKLARISPSWRAGSRVKRTGSLAWAVPEAAAKAESTRAAKTAIDRGMSSLLMSSGKARPSVPTGTLENQYSRKFSGSDARPAHGLSSGSTSSGSSPSTFTWTIWSTLGSLRPARRNRAMSAGITPTARISTSRDIGSAP